MKQTLFIAAFLFFTSGVRAQTYWAQGTGGNDVDETMDICQGVGGIISAGYFTNKAAFGSSTTLTSASVGVPDVYVAKSTSIGIVQWAVRAGGSGSDRALSVTTDASNNIYITGFYYGAAMFGSIILNSVNGSQDAFIAKLDPSGNFLWAVSAGGSMADIGNAVSIDGNGDVLVTGQFQGTATFGSTQLTSMTNPQLGIPSIDIFTAKYDGSGNFLWVRQGKAKYTDRGLDVVADGSGNVFVCGQFSDTIQFNQVYNNQVMNAVFLIKYDASGNEIWFRRASGTFSIAYSLVLNSNHEIYVTGDYQGNLAFYGTPNNFLSDTYPKCVFLAKYDANGNFIWAQSESSTNYISSRAVALDASGDPYLAGEFGCTLNEYADVFGKGTFNSVGYQDIFTVKYNASNGQRQWMRNFGGPGNDKAHGILVNVVDNPVVAGSYEKKMYWAVNTMAYPTNNMEPGFSGNTSYCNDGNYGAFYGIHCAGFSDGFISQAIDISRQPYDYYHRTGAGCLRGFVGGCADTMLSCICPDTLRFCGEGYLYGNTHTGSGLAYSVGPDYDFLWSASAHQKTHYIDTINMTGYYSVKMTTTDGCYTSSDSIYAIVNPLPQAPTITDDHGVNFQQPQWGLPISACKPDTILLVGGNINGNSLAWYSSGSCFPGGAYLTSNDSVYVSSSGVYNVVLTNQYGCKNFNCVPVLLDTALTPINPISQIPDTLVACYGDLVKLLIIDSITGQPGPFFNIACSWGSSPPLSIACASSYLQGLFTATNSGMYIVNDSITYFNKCDTLKYFVEDTFYLLVNPLPVASVSISGPNYMCQGDTVILHIAYTSAGGPNTVVITNPVIDSIIVTNAGEYGASILVKDTVTGCSQGMIFGHKVKDYPNPILTTSPSSGLICPNDSVQIICNTLGTNYQWIGPTGILPFNTQSIYRATPGFYHCIVTNTVSCVLTSNTVELKQYNTPYLLPSPSNIVCLGQSVSLQVITNDTTLIQWNPPLTGGGTTQTVTQSGVYSCNVTMCGITTLCTMTVVVSQAVAQITGPIVVCPGDSVLLVANPGMAGYQWLPISSFNDSVYVQAGTYFVTTTDKNGCTAAASVAVTLDTSVAKPVAGDTSICAGGSATLYAAGIGPIEWYSSATSSAPVHVGNSFTTPVLWSTTTYYVATSNSVGCHSLRDSATVTIVSTSLPPVIFVTDTVCIGGIIVFNTPVQQSATYLWTGPNGFSSIQPSTLLVNASLVSAGVYTLAVSGNGCTSPPVTDTVVVIAILTPVISGSDTVCQDDSIVMNITNPVSGSMYYWTGPSAFFSNGSSVVIFPATILHSGIYNVYGTIGGCMSSVASFTVHVSPGGPAVTASSNSPVCAGDSLLLSAVTSGSNVMWQGPSGFSSIVPNPLIFPATVSNSGMYIVASLLNGCAGIPAYLNVTVNSLPSIDLGPDTTICDKKPWTLYPQGSFASLIWFDSTTSNFHVIDSTGLYYATVTDANGCSNADSVKVLEIICDGFLANVFTPNGDGVYDVFSFSGYGYRKVVCEIYDRWGRNIYGWDDPEGGWDGSDFRSNKPLGGGTYYYVATIQKYDGQDVTLKGFIELLK